MSFRNVYEDGRRAEAYAKLEFPGTYYLAYRDVPDIVRRHVKGTRALDFGCGTGRSVRFLTKLGFDVVGVDIAEEMLRKARERDPAGDYRLVREGDIARLTPPFFDLVQSIFTFDNVPTEARKVELFAELRDVLGDEGTLINLVSSPEIYTHEWSSFTTKAYPENLLARSGDRVRIVMTDVEDARPVEDVLWSDEAYHAVYERARLRVEAVYRPLAKESEPYPWVSETRIAPWVIYVLRKA